MQHFVPEKELGSWPEPMSQAIENCVHCGFCLPACPTYRIMGDEMNSPRGRIFLMKETLEGNIGLDSALPYIDRCLGCLGCVPACPSGVKYGELLTPFRALAESKRRRGLIHRIQRNAILRTIPYASRFRFALFLAKMMAPLKRVLPRSFRPMIEILPAKIPSKIELPDFFPAEGSCRGRVALIAGCAQQVLSPDINLATLRVLAKNGIETVVPKAQTCCGAIAAHTGDMATAQRFARKNLAAFPMDVDAIVTNAAGCGSGIHEYPLWLEGSTDINHAKNFAQKSCDVSVFLEKIGLRTRPKLTQPTRIAYHDACHLAHAQNVKTQPRSLLREIQNVELVEIPLGDQCCGSAGTYNLEQPDSASQLGTQKAASILTTNADVVATGNIGCLTQIQMHLQRKQSVLPVVHTIQILDRAYRNQNLDQ